MVTNMEYKLNDIVEMKKAHPCKKSTQWQIIRMGADIKIEGRTAVVKGVDQLYGANVNATDLRAGAALILCGLIAEGETQIGKIYHIQRGYVDIDKKIRSLGGNIEIVEC